MKRCLLILLILSVFSGTSSATHLMGGEITWECVKTGPDAGKYIFTVKVYRDCQGVPIDTLMFLEAHNIPSLTSINLIYVGANDLSPSCDTIDSPNTAFSCGGVNLGYAGNGVGAVEEHIYKSEAIIIPGSPDVNGWHFTWSSCCRNLAITNLANNTGQYGFTLRAVMYSFTDSSGVVYPNSNNCFDSSPKFYEKPRTILEVGNGYDPLAFSNGFTYSHNAFDDERDSLYYSWAHPLDNIYDYLNPNAAAIPFDASVLPLAYNNPINGILINPQTGKTWYNASSQGNFVTCTKVSAYNCGQLVSEVYREIQVVLTSPVCNLGDTTGGNLGADTLCNIRPLVQPPFFFPLASPQYQWDTIVHCGDTVAFDFLANDYDINPNGSLQDLQFTVSGGQFMDYNVNPPGLCGNPPCATFEETSTGATPPFITAGGTGIGSFEWITSCNHLISTCGNAVKPSLYTFVIKVQDDFCPAPAIENTAQVISIMVCPPCNLLKSNPSSTPVTCSSNYGSAMVNPTDGFPPYYDFWFDMNGIPVNPDSLVAGDYQVRVRDSSLCERVDTVTVGSLIAVISSNVSITDASCSMNNGTAQVAPSGGTPPYSVFWSDLNGVTVNPNALGAGDYIIRVIDSMLCEVIDTITINNPLSMPSIILSATSVTCYGASDGTISSLPSGGQAPYVYSWSNGDTTQSISNVSAGTYVLTLYDLNNCIVIDSITVTEPPSFQVSISSSNGVLTGSSSGGTSPYTYEFLGPNGLIASSSNNFGNSFSITPINSGNYSFLVIDANGCSDSATIYFSLNFSPTVTVSLSNLYCDSLTDLTIEVAQDSGEVDMSTALFQSNDGYFDIISMTVGDTIGTAYLMAAGGSININTSLVVASIVSSNQAIIHPCSSVNGCLGSFTITNTVGGGIEILSQSVPDGNNYTNGNMSSVTFNNVFVNPCGPLIFTSTINSELGDVYVQTISFLTTLMQEFSKRNIRIYPNPSNGKITLEMNEVNHDRYNVIINNLLGQTVHTIEQEISGFFTEDIDITKFGEGTYLITISNSLSKITEKVIVE